MAVELRDYQIDAIRRMKNGCILCGGVGSGKSRTALAYYFLLEGGNLNDPGEPPNKSSPRDLYIITTARKRDTMEWDDEMNLFRLYRSGDYNVFHNKIVVDSWNNISKYKEVEHAFFIFDEQRVVGKGAWVKSFLKITKANSWILLSATPGDTWMDYVPVFIANGFYKNRTEFTTRHVVYSRFAKFPKVDRYLEEGRLVRLRNSILVTMDYKKTTTPHQVMQLCEYDRILYNDTMKRRRNPYDGEPLVNASDLCYTLRKIVNSDLSRLEAVNYIFESKKKLIVFYNFDYELEMLYNFFSPMTNVAEWNGHKHEPIPNTKEWIYLVQYTAGAEGWNCTKTDTIVFYSQNYSYKVMVQASGRIDRLNTPYSNLYFYHLYSKSSIDLAIRRALKCKKRFQESSFAQN